MNARKLWMAALGTMCVPGAAVAQVPDLLNAFDAGGRAMGMGGATYQTGSDTLSSYYNPAGLGYVTRSQLGFVFRNLPESETILTGDLNPGQTRYSSSGAAGPTGMSHVGLAFPLGGGNNGAVGISLTTGGVIRDERTAGAGLTDNGLPAGSFTQLLKNKIDFVNLSYGRNAGSVNWGVGVVFAQSAQTNITSNEPSGNTFFDETARGWGFQAGMQFQPADNPDVAWGISYRSAIELKGRSGITLLQDRIPARLAGGFAIRRSGFRGNRDYMVLGVDVQHFFSGSQGVLFDRNPQTVVGLGVEYNYSLGNARIPLRLGYNAVPAGGDSYGNRNTFTFGFGYRPDNADWGLDLNFGRAQNGGTDMSLAVSYKFGQ